MSTLQVWQLLPWMIYPVTILYILPFRWLYFSANSQNLRKATTIFFTLFCSSVRLSVCMVNLSSNWTDFCEILYLNTLRSSAEKIQVSLLSDTNSRYFTWRPICIDDNTSFIFLSMRNVSDKSCLRKSKHFIFNNFLRKPCSAWGNVKKYRTATYQQYGVTIKEIDTFNVM